MKKNTLRSRFCLLLSTLLLAGSLLTMAACANTKSPAETEGATDGSITEAAGTVVETEGPNQTLDVPDVHYNGETFRVYSIRYDSGYTMLDVEKLTSEPVNDAIYERNRIIEDRFGIRFECEGDEWMNMYNHLSLQVNAGNSGADGYDLIMLIARDAYKATLNNYLLPYDRLEYIDIEKDYYFRNINEQYRLGDHTFFAFGKDSINVMGFSCGLLYNKEIAEDLKTGNLYDTVRHQEWTFEKLFTYAENAVMDLNGDSAFVMGEDRLGLIGHYDVTVPDFWISAGEYLVEKDENNMPVCRLESNERMINIMQETLNHIDTSAYSVLALGDINKAFMEDKALFISLAIHKLYEIRPMETDYGVIPFPKYDTEQENYVTRSIDGWLNCVPTTCRDTEMTSVIMQALAYYSDQTVYDAYYEQALKTRFMRDSDSVEMVELMLDTLQVDLGDTIWYEQVRLPLVDKMVQSGSHTPLTSTFKASQRRANQQIEKAVAYIDGLKS